MPRSPRSLRTASSRPTSRQWMEYIRQHLVQNLSIDREDFDDVSRSCPITAAGDGPTASSTASSTELSTELNKELVAA